MFRSLVFGFIRNRMWCFLWVTCCVIATLGQAKEENSTLVLVQMLFRHGFRTSVYQYPDDPTPPDDWFKTQGQLTKLGIKQQYVMGKYFRSFYSDFITSNPNEVRVSSSDYDRCRKSALSLLASLYAPSPEWAFEEGVEWQPIDVHYLPIDTDKYLSVLSDCPRFFEEQTRRYNSTEFLDSVAKYQALFEILKQHRAVSNLPAAMHFQEMLEIARASGEVLPSWIDPHYDELKELSELLFTFLYNTPMQQRFRVGPLLGKIVGNMDAKITGNIPQLKMEIFSAHDANIAAILLALNMYNYKRPPFSSTLIFELHQRPSNEIRMLFFNSTQPENVTSHVPIVLQLEGCGEFCPLEKFRELVLPYVPEDWESECRGKNSDYKMPDNTISGVHGKVEPTNNAADSGLKLKNRFIILQVLIVWTCLKIVKLL